MRVGVQVTFGDRVEAAGHMSDVVPEKLVVSPQRLHDQLWTGTNHRTGPPRVEHFPERFERQVDTFTATTPRDQKVELGGRWGRRNVMPECRVDTEGHQLDVRVELREQ